MALATNSTGDFTSVRNPFNLQTQQKRLRHLTSISVHNLHTGDQGSEHISHLQCYFTLHRNASTPAFYQSETITGSTNPSWKSFDISQFEEEIDLSAKFLVVRVWVGQKESFRLMIVMEVHLSGLHFLADKLRQVLVKHAPNTVVFGLLDKEFIFINKKQSRVKNLAKKIADFDLPSSLLPAVVKVEKASVRNSYTSSSLSRIQTVLRAIKQMQAHARRYRRQIEDKLLASQENSQRLEQREHLHMSVGQLRQELLRRTTYLHQSQEKLHSVREAVMLRVKTVNTDTELVKNHWQLLHEDKRDHIVKREQLVKENALLNLRRRQMLNELYSYVYPITTEDGTKYFINGVWLPHAEELQGRDELMVAVGLSYSCHLTIKMSQILGLPLRHPMENRSSKSVIYDQVHSKLADKDREFPLYSKGKDKYHFNYGVFLLNKNISQLRFQCSVPTLDLRLILQNLLTLLHKLGVRIEGQTAVAHAFTSTPDGTVLSRTSPNGSSVGTGQVPSLLDMSANGETAKAQGYQSGQQHSKTSDFSEDGSTVASVTDNPTPRTKGERKRVGFDESEDIFKPAGDDHFFKVNTSPLSEFNQLSIGDASLSETGDLLAPSSGSAADDHQTNARVSALLQTASEGETLVPKSFQLIKQNKADNKENGEGDSDVSANGKLNGCESELDGAGASDGVCNAALDDSVCNDGVNGLGGKEDDETQSDHHSRREDSTGSGSIANEVGLSGAAAFSEPRDSYSLSSTSRNQHLSDFGDLDSHSVQLTDIDMLLLIED